jgi:hypothetical protein
MLHLSCFLTLDRSAMMSVLWILCALLSKDSLLNVIEQNFMNSQGFGLKDLSEYTYYNFLPYHHCLS